MAITLAQAQLNAQTDLDVAVIDEFRTNPFLDMMMFDDCVNPAGGGATLTYGYRRLVAPANAAFRAINTEYTPADVSTAHFTTELKPLGGSFQIDRVLANIGAAASGEVALQMSQKIKAAQAKFGEAAILGDTAVDALGFDGLSKALVGSSTEDTTAIDLSGAQDMTWAFKVLSTVDDLLSMMDGPASALIGNRRLINIVRAAARMTAQYTVTPGPRATSIERYGSAVLVDAGLKAGSGSDVVVFNVADPDGAGILTAGSTALYAVRIGMDGFHGVSVAGGSIVKQYAPDFSTPGAVKTGEVELGPVAVCLKRTKAAAVKRNIKVA